MRYPVASNVVTLKLNSVHGYTLAARLIRIVDVYGALTSSRPYRHAFMQARVLEIIRDERQHFDPQLLDPFTQIISAE